MAKRKIITIDRELCNGCGECIPNCPEGAIQIIDNKACLVSDLFCDGLGACLGHCPVGAISIEEREAKNYDERKVMENIVLGGANVIRAHLEHLRSHGETKYLEQAQKFLQDKGIPLSNESTLKQSKCAQGGCPGSKMMDLRNAAKKSSSVDVSLESQLRQWPVQLGLVGAHAPYLDNADILVAADCVPFAYANFHQHFLKDKIVLVGCPKFDDVNYYEEKLRSMFENNTIKSVTYVHMEVPCCFGLVSAIQNAIKTSGKKVPFIEKTISIQGEVIS